ncbi:hypothetical protein PIB30_050005 [Stylosanthes scabra]|uniref:Uncharacterized protein n=1 Tax=Stylosanthes scabra TaxID=79078 RepID=A0ABU6THW0_9FABA|nr:hypothetical protein [Stylosanthes scabra]
MQIHMWHCLCHIRFTTEMSSTGRILPPRPPPQDQPAEQPPPPETSVVPSTSAQYSLEHSYQQVMRHLERQERLLCHQGRQIANTQLMIRQAFPETEFTSLEEISSDERSDIASF